MNASLLYRNTQLAWALHFAAVYLSVARLTRTLALAWGPSPHAVLCRQHGGTVHPARASEPGGRQGRGRRASQARGVEAGERLDVAGDGGLAPVATAWSRGYIVRRIIAGVGLDDLLAGKYPTPGMRPHCGRGP